MKCRVFCFSISISSMPMFVFANSEALKIVIDVKFKGGETSAKNYMTSWRS